ncbi:MAG: hypothetical protein CVV23_00805 [Ignavibacteriae bacterium HGW-Ignavibacteriae-2]|nr:MAG: hypothetical protein CVV23_00805 [Ignavibacteriae bacterium HGW-Ignavibacteriae-2]
MKHNKIRQNKKWFYLIAVSIPFVFIIMVELLLRTFDYGKNLEQWIEGPYNKIYLNPDIAFRYFNNTEAVPYSAGDMFDETKKPDSYRIFILGASSAAGFPFSPNGTFAQYISKRFSLEYPDKNFEVINLSMAAINSYTLKDILPGVLDQSPDLVIIYAGHNEYYGALGVGSLESFGGSPYMVDLVMALSKYKITQLVSNTIKSTVSLFSETTLPSGTLIKRMAKDKEIIFGSQIYKDGINQFTRNMERILSDIKKSGVSVIISTLVSNINGMQPFISENTQNFPSARWIFNEARFNEKKGDYVNADSLYRYAKDLDLLKFRAPEEINYSIKKLANKYKIHIVDSDSLFKFESPNGIIGNNLLTDHVHPTLAGYQNIGRLYSEYILSHNLIPGTIQTVYNNKQQDSIVRAGFNFSELDSAIGRVRLLKLKNDWPYKTNTSLLFKNDYNLTSFIDSIAYKVVNENYSWEKAHRDAVDYYISKRKIDKTIKEIDVLINQFPFIIGIKKYSVNSLIDNKYYEYALPYLMDYYSLESDAYCTKWLGTIYLSMNNVESAIKYLTESIKFNSGDAQVFYNLAGAYMMNKQYTDALNNINRCIVLKPDYPNANGFKEQLQSILN